MKGIFKTPIKNNNQCFFEIPGINGETLEIVVKCCYTNKIDLNEKNAEAVIKIASILQMTELEDICKQYFRSRMWTANCLRVLQIGEKYGLDDLKSYASAFTFRYLGNVAKCQEFMHLNSINLSYILRNDDLKIDGEEKVFKILMRWIQYDKEERMSLFETLVKHVRFYHISASVRPILIVSSKLYHYSNLFSSIL